LHLSGFVGLPADKPLQRLRNLRHHSATALKQGEIGAPKMNLSVLTEENFVVMSFSKI
jgi:hypothetical protein